MSGHGRLGRGSVILCGLTVLVVLSSCTLLGPREKHIGDWLKLPAAGATYTYRTTTTWFDQTKSIQDRSYLVERVAEEDSGRVVIKFANLETEGLESFFWLIDPSAGTIYESAATSVSDADLLVLMAPVAERAEWEHGTIGYEVARTGITASTDAGKAKDVVTVELDYYTAGGSRISGVSGEIRWSPTFGLISYTEEYAPTSGSYLEEVVRELISVEEP